MESQAVGQEIENAFKRELKGLDVQIKNQIIDKATEEILRIKASTQLITTQEKMQLS